MIALAVALLLSLTLGIHAARPPAPLGLNALAARFSAARAMRDIAAIGIRPHPTGTADNLRVRTYLTRRLDGMGLETEQRQYLIDDASSAKLAQWSGGTDRPSVLVDVIGILHGRNPALPALLLMAHYDTVWGSPGAADDSYGVATALETVRAIAARGRPARDVIVLFTDGEEIGLSGARAFWSATEGLPHHVGVVINMESRGSGGRTIMFETGQQDGAMMALFGRAVPHPLANSLAAAAYEKMPNRTDFSVVRPLGMAGFNFAMLGRPALYHSAYATIDRDDPGTLQDMGGQVLPLAAALAFAPKLPGTALDATFFDLAGGHFVRYAPALGWLVVLGAVLAFAVAWVGARRGAAVSGTEVARGFGACLWLVLVAGLMLYAFNQVSLTPDGNGYNRLAALSRLEAQAGLALIAALIGFFALAQPVRWWMAWLPPLAVALIAWHMHGSGWTILVALAAGTLTIAASRQGVPLWGGWLGALALLVLFAIVAQAKAPLGAWIFAWPALVLAVGAAAVAWSDPGLRRPWGAPIAGAAAVLVTVPLLALTHLLFLAPGDRAAVAFALLAPIPAAAFWPLARMEAGRRLAWLIAAALAVAALAIAIRVHHAPLSPTVPAYSIGKPTP